MAITYDEKIDARIKRKHKEMLSKIAAESNKHMSSIVRKILADGINREYKKLLQNQGQYSLDIEE